MNKLGGLEDRSNRQTDGNGWYKDGKVQNLRGINCLLHHKKWHFQEKCPSAKKLGKIFGSKENPGTFVSDSANACRYKRSKSGDIKTKEFKGTTYTFLNKWGLWNSGGSPQLSIDHNTKEETINLRHSSGYIAATHKNNPPVIAGLHLTESLFWDRCRKILVLRLSQILQAT